MDLMEVREWAMGVSVGTVFGPKGIVTTSLWRWAPSKLAAGKGGSCGYRGRNKS